MLASGTTYQEIADIYGVTRGAVSHFWDAHDEAIARVQAQIEREVTEYAIAQKVNRIAGLDQLASEIRAVIDERGLIERTTTTTENAEIVRERFAREIPAELRAVFHAAAEEMDQLPKGTAGNVSISGDKVAVFLGGPELGV